MKRIKAENAGEETVGYRSDHEAPCALSGTAIWDLCGKAEIYPEDVYGPDALRMYTDGDDKCSAESLAVLQSIRNRPDATVVVYRAVPYVPSTQERLDLLSEHKRQFLRRNQSPPNPMRLTGSEWYNWACEQEEVLRNQPSIPSSYPAFIARGDWVTLSKTYANKHGKGNLKNEFKVLSAGVKASLLYCDGNSLNEVGYWGPQIDLKMKVKGPSP